MNNRYRTNSSLVRNNHNNDTTVGAFTLIEVLLIITLIAILAAITFIVINPAKNFADARNTQRQSDVTQILNAVTQYLSEPGNTLSDLGVIATCPTTNDIGITTNGINLDAELTPNYIVDIPKDPTAATERDTGYDICQTTSGRITVSAPSAENGVTIDERR